MTDSARARTDLSDIVRLLDELLQTDDTPDYPNAVNGLQLANSGRVTKVAAAVDFSSLAVASAAAAEANLLIVHHGMFWSGLEPIRGPGYERMRQLIGGDIAVYSSHLPLDRHPTFGNNVLLARELGLAPSEGFARFQAIDIGVRGEADLDTADLVARASTFAKANGGDLRTTPVRQGHRTRRWAICTGAGASAETLREAAAHEIDTLIVGEGAHWTAVHAADNDIVILYAGHYATETLGVRALAQHVGERFSIPSVFLPHPTGL